MPTDPAVKAAWLEALTIGHNQGCGHFRLMLDQFADYGLQNADVPKSLIKYCEPPRLGRRTLAQTPVAAAPPRVDAASFSLARARGAATPAAPAWHTEGEDRHTHPHAPHTICGPAGWGTPRGSEERSKVKFSVVQGPLDGHAVAIVNSNGCPGRSPALPPSHDGSQLFM